MSDVTPEYNARVKMFDKRTFQFGQVWKIKDPLISIPDADRLLHGRNLHKDRYVIIAQNNEENLLPMVTCITIIPLSSRVDLKRKYDVILSPNVDSVKVESMAKTSLIQPVLKKDLDECLGSISKEKMAEVIDALLERLGLSPEDI